MGDDFPTRIADLLEAFATKVRSMTVDRIARLITFITLGIVALMLVSLAMIFLLVGIFRIVAELIHKAGGGTWSMEITYAIVGGVFLGLGALLWRKRTHKPAGEASS
jgi:hypothetical protein